MTEKTINENNDNNITSHQDLDVSIIPVSEIKNYSDNEISGCSQYDSGELADYSNVSLTTTNDSSGSNFCVHHSKVNPLDDPIIQEMFKQRTVEMDQIEEERRIRMYTMMRYSKKYKHLQTERANMKWDQMHNNCEHTEKSLKDLDKLVIPDSEGNSLEDNGNLSNWFSDTPPRMQRSISVKHSQSNFGIDLHDLDLIDMELNNSQNIGSENNNDDDDDDGKDKDQDHEEKSNRSDTTNEELNLNEDIKIYSNNKQQSFGDITKSNSKLSTSSSENDTNNNKLIKSHYKFSSNSSKSISNKSQSFNLPEGNIPKINNYLSNSDINTLASSTMSSTNEFGNYDSIQLYSSKNYQSKNNNSRNKVNKEKNKNRKLKLFKLGHKNKNTIEINDTSTFNKVTFQSKSSLDNNSDETVNQANSLLDFDDSPPFNKSILKPNDKKKKHAFISFFLGKKYSKSIENENENENTNENNNDNNIKKSIEFKNLKPEKCIVNRELSVRSNEKCFKKVKSLLFSDSVNIIPYS